MEFLVTFPHLPADYINDFEEFYEPFEPEVTLLTSGEEDEDSTVNDEMNSNNDSQQSDNESSDSDYEQLYKKRQRLD